MTHLEKLVRITVEVKAGAKISTVEASKYANQYVQAFVGSYKQITPAGRKLLKDAGVLEHGNLSMQKIWKTLDRHRAEVVTAQELIDNHNARIKRSRSE